MDISLESSWNAFAFILSLDTVAAAAERIEWDGAVKRGVSAWREITGAVVGRRSMGRRREVRVVRGRATVR